MQETRQKNAEAALPWTKAAISLDEMETERTEVVGRVNITDAVLLRRLEIVRVRLGDPTLTRTARRLLEERLYELGIPSLPDEATEKEAQ